MKQNKRSFPRASDVLKHYKPPGRFEPGQGRLGPQPAPAWGSGERVEPLFPGLGVAPEGGRADPQGLAARDSGLFMAPG